MLPLLSIGWFSISVRLRNINLIMSGSSREFLSERCHVSNLFKHVPCAKKIDGSWNVEHHVHMDSVISSKLIFRWYGHPRWHTSLWKRFWSHGCRAFSSPASDMSPRVAPALFSYDNIVFSQNPIQHMWAAMQRLTRTRNYVPIGVQHGIMHWHSSCLSVSQFPRKMTRNQYEKNNQLLCACRNQY